MNAEEKCSSYINTDPADEVVISGIAGRFPSSNNIKHLQENLFNKIDLVHQNHDRWNLEHSDIPPRLGTIKNIKKFDADFFGVFFDQAHTFDPTVRMLLEHTYEAIVDAGVNPKELRGRNTAVIIGTSYLESQQKFLYENLQIGGLGIVGCGKFNISNMISHWLDVKGPSYTIDSACSSGLYVIAIAYRAIMSGQCEDAIVGGSNLCLDPFISFQFSRLGVLSSEGYCRPFDIAANGYARSESMVVVYLRKAKHAKRVYATCKYIKLNNDGYKNEGIMSPSSKMQGVLLQDVFNECGISPSYLDYFETHGTGTKIGDPKEINAISNVLCKSRKTPLMIGSVKSNLGHAEIASAWNQIAKVIIAFETGYVPPNINFTKPREDINALLDGSVRVVTEPLPLKRGFIGINSFGFGGSNAHMLLKWNPKKKSNDCIPSDNLPRLIVLSGRTEESVKSFLNDVANQSTDVEYIRLLHDIHADNIDGHPWRGYSILNLLEENPINEIRKYEDVKRPVCFLFSTLGSQWSAMGQGMLKFSVFADSMKKCDAALKLYGISATCILDKSDRRMCENVMHAFVGTIAIQIGLVDLLTSIGIVPDYMINYSAGELVSAYADGCLTTEQTILSAYFIGLACMKKEIVRGSMAIINLDYECLKNMCPMDIEIACRNNKCNNIVTGPSKSIQKFIRKLQTNNIHAEEIFCNNIPYHSRYLSFVESELLRNLNQVISCPKERSQRWISTSVPRKEWTSLKAKLSSASYHTHSILDTILFEQAYRTIPHNAVIIDITPNSILRDILQTSLHQEIIALMECNKRNDVNIFLQGIGKLYNCGLQPQVANLYPSVEFPVSRGTPMISPSIRWNHTEDWFTLSYDEVQYKNNSKERIVVINVNNEELNYMTGHIIDGKNLLPAPGYLALVWQTFSMTKGNEELYSAKPIIFRDVKFVRVTHLEKKDVHLTITILEDSGKFEILEEDSIVVTGTVYSTPNTNQEMISIDFLPKNGDEEEEMSSEDIYKELKLRGYQYNGAFRGLQSASISGRSGYITWIGNWVTFIDNMLQMYIYGTYKKDLFIPTSIQKLLINPALHMQKVREVPNKLLPIRVYREIDAIISGGIEFRGFKATAISRRKGHPDPVIEEYKFVAHCDGVNVSLDEAFRISIQLVLEDHQVIKVNAVELVEDNDNIKLEDLSSLLIVKTVEDMPLIQTNINMLTSPNRFKSVNLPSCITIADLNKSHDMNNVLIITGFNLLSKHQSSLERVLPFLREGGYLITREKNATDYSKYLRKYQLHVILEKRIDKEIFVLLKKNITVTKRIVIYINNTKFDWLDKLKMLLTDENELDVNSRIMIVGEKDPECGILGFITCLRKEPGGERVRSVFVQDEEAPKFSLQDPFYLEQLQKDMAINVLRANKIWGSYRHLPLPHSKAEPVTAAYISQRVPGDLSTLYWIENNIHVDSSYEDLIHVVHSSINFKDIMLATGKLKNDPTAISQGHFQQMNLGMEYVGFDSNGNRVMGLGNKCIANIVLRDKDLCWDIPDTWTFEEAATIPCVYATCYYALFIRGNIKKGDKILIHSGAGGIGQSAICLALNEGCEVFITAGTAEKRKMIRNTFPSIPGTHIGNSRDTSFEQMIMRETNGQGVNIVLNSLAEEKLIASIRCLARNGRFLEIGKYDFISNNPLDIGMFAKGISFHGIVMDNILFSNNKYKSRVYRMMAEGFKNGVIKPIPAKIFSKTEIEKAFRYMANGKHIGKVIVNIQGRDTPLDAPIVAYHRYYCHSDKNYIILGGLGGFGLELTEWLVLRGAKNILLTSRTGIKNGYQRMKINLLESYGVNILIMDNIDVANPTECEYLLRTAEKKATVDAIFNLAVILRDDILENQTTESFVESFKSKAWATQTIDKLSRQICFKLRHFVVFSSVSCGKGNAGQTNYGMANSIMERICERRVEEGLPGLAIQWGAVGDVGLVAEMQKNDNKLVIGGTSQQIISSCLEELEHFLLQNSTIVSSLVVSEKSVKFPQLQSTAEAIAAIMNIKDMKSITHNTFLVDLGMDSMVAVEIKQTLESKFDIFLTLQEIRNLNFAKLSKMSSMNVCGGNSSVKQPSETNVPI